MRGRRRGGRRWKKSCLFGDNSGWWRVVEGRREEVQMVIGWWFSNFYGLFNNHRFNQKQLMFFFLGSLVNSWFWLGGFICHLSMALTLGMVICTHSKRTK